MNSRSASPEGRPPGAPRPVLAIVGATGAVGTTMCEIVSTRPDIWGEVRPIASARSVGKQVTIRGDQVTVQEITPEVFDGVDLAMFDVPDEVSAVWAPVAAERGVIVIDKSGAFRSDPQVPLVVPEVNPHAAFDRPKGIISVPNCTTLSMICVIGVLHQAYRLRELFCASYQAASGAGQAGIESLYDQLAAVGGNRALGQRPGDVRAAVPDTGAFSAPLAMNVLPWAGSLRPDGWNSEELKLRNETRKILGLDDIKISATCVRVPVITGHSLALHAVFDAEVDRDEAAKLLSEAPGVKLVDRPEAGEFPMPIDVVGTDPTLVGRIRVSLDDPRALDLFVCGDNLRKGAALNAAQIAELLVAG
ncbi:MAG TPA: aspartate-semialdehyde dehydrogenase [Streptosporangiaceae bacterium]|nr:aspartate-semialdehyde dehydrogenase [Streptosporangiaceae bacterium]